jgi:putative oxidoreductase
MHIAVNPSIASSAGIGKLIESARTSVKSLNFAAPAADLVIRLWVANVFWLSGLSKVQSIDSTLLLFQYEYSVPLLSPAVAAYLSIFAELTFSALLALGLAGRFAASILFFVNIVAVISYPALEQAGLQQHYLWGLLLLVPIFHGPGKLSIDYLIAQWFDARRS